MDDGWFKQSHLGLIGLWGWVRLHTLHCLPRERVALPQAISGLPRSRRRSPAEPAIAKAADEESGSYLGGVK